MLNKNSCCSYCGVLFQKDLPFPKECYACKNITYLNPIPIVVVLLSVETFNLDVAPAGHGIIIQQRNIEPGKGKWALPSGYIDFGETWQQAAAREVMEEMVISTTADKYNLLEIKNSSNGNMLIFCNYSDLVQCDRELFVPNEEVMDIDVAYTPIELAFPSHTEVVDSFLKVKSHGR
jgi:NUDIX domain